MVTLRRLILLVSSPLVWAVALSVFIASHPVTAAAQQSELKAASADKVDAVLLLDVSGSMRLTDPQRLRDEGAKLFMEFLKPGDNLAVVAFSDKTKVLQPLQPFEPAMGESISAELRRISNDGLYTDILSAVKTAQELLSGEKRADANASIILLSDGRMDPDPAEGTAEAFTNDLLNTVLPELKAANIRLHTLAFSDQADKDLLSQIALATNGMNWFAAEPEKIHEAFANLFLVVKKPQVAPLTSRGFRIDGDIQEATFYVNHEPEEQLTLYAPNGQAITANTLRDGGKWFRGQNFDAITVVKPELGEWRIGGLSTKEGFATLLTSLKLVTAWPGNVYSGDKVVVQARLFEADKPVVLPEMSDVARYAYQITPTDKVSPPTVREALHDDGKDGDKVARDGIFSAETMLEEPGEYKLEVVASTPTFERHQQIPFRLKPRLVSVAVITLDAHAAAESSPELKNEAGRKFFEVRLSPEALHFKDVRVDLFAIDKDRRKYKLPLQETATKDQYLAPVEGLPRDGAFSLEAKLAGRDRRGKEVEASSSRLQYVQSGEGAAEEHHEEVVEVKVPPRPVKHEPSSIPAHLLVALVNLLVGGMGIMRLRKGQGVQDFTVPQFTTPEIVLKALAKLEEKMSLTEIDFNDPLFAVEGPSLRAAASEPPPAGANGSAAAAQPAPAAEVPAGESGGEAPTPAPAEETPAETAAEVSAEEAG